MAAAVALAAARDRWTMIFQYNFGDELGSFLSAIVAGVKCASDNL